MNEYIHFFQYLFTMMLIIGFYPFCNQNFFTFSTLCSFYEESTRGFTEYQGLLLKKFRNYNFYIFVVWSCYTYLKFLPCKYKLAILYLKLYLASYFLNEIKIQLINFYFANQISVPWNFFSLLFSHSTYVICLDEVSDEVLRSRKCLFYSW